MTRHEEREFALKILFAAEFQNGNWGQQLELLEKEENIQSTEFILKLCKLYWEHHNEIDALIKAHLKNWDFQRIAIMDKIILRMALTEMYKMIEIPVEVSINEAVELAKAFGTDNSKKFVNGVLDTVYREEGSKIKEKALSDSFKGSGKT